MTVVSTKGRIIPNITRNTGIVDGDYVVIHDVSAKTTTIATVGELKSNFFSNLTIAANFSNVSNLFTGSFYGTVNSLGSFYDLYARNNLTIAGGVFNVDSTSALTSISSTAINLGTTGTTALAIGHSATLISINSPLTTFNGNLTATYITASGWFVGDITGSLSGSVTGSLTGSITGSGQVKLLSNTGVVVLDNGSGGVETANFYGTSSYALSSSHGQPIGGSSGQVLTKDSGTNYDSSWATPGTGTSAATVKTLITSSMGGTDQYLAMFSPNGHKIGNSSIREYAGYLGITKYLSVTSTFNSTINKLNSSEITSSNFRGIYDSTLQNVTMSQNTSSFAGPLLTGYGQYHLYLNATAPVSMSLTNGQSTNVLVRSTINTVSDWSGSSPIEWSGGTAYAGTSGQTDVISFKHIGNKIYGTFTSNYS